MGNTRSANISRSSRRAAVLALAGLVSLTLAACQPADPGDHDLRVTVVSPPSRVAIGSSEYLNLYLNNDGTAVAPNARLAIIVPNTMSVTPRLSMSCTPPLPFGSAASYIVCSPGDLDAGGFRQTLLSVQGISVSPALDVRVFALSDQPEDPNGGPNELVVPIEVRQPWFDLAVSPISTLGPLTVGTEVGHFVRPMNVGPLDAPTFTFTSTWSPNVIVNSVIAYGYSHGQLVMPSCSVTGQTAKCVIPAGLGPQAMYTNDLTVSMRVTPTSPGAVSVTNQVVSAVAEVDDPTSNVLVQNGTIVAP